jgi:hypothetical protein
MPAASVMPSSWSEKYRGRHAARRQPRAADTIFLGIVRRVTQERARLYTGSLRPVVSWLGKYHACRAARAGSPEAADAIVLGIVRTWEWRRRSGLHAGSLHAVAVV